MSFQPIVVWFVYVRRTTSSLVALRSRTLRVPRTTVTDSMQIP
jgi:hypothetical protein